MEKGKAIPEGYMTVGELAKKMGTTVRTLQYYDQEGLLSPSSESDGGRRLYTDKDMIQLYQILSLKSLGFSLDDIKNCLITLDTPKDVAQVLEQQALSIREKLESLSESLKEIEALRMEVLQMQTVDFKRYSDIIMNLQMKNEFYWMIKNMDDTTLEYLRKRFDKETGLAMIATCTRLLDEAIQYQTSGVLPDSEAGQKLAKEYWDMIMEFTSGDRNILSNLVATEFIDGSDNEWQNKHQLANAFIEPALEVYFNSINYNPFEEE